MVKPNEDVYEEEIDGPGLSWNGILETCALSSPLAFRGAELPAR